MMRIIVVTTRKPLPTMIRIPVPREVMKLRPIVILGPTALGAALLGLLGAAPPTPRAATIIGVVTRLPVVKHRDDGAPTALSTNSGPRADRPGLVSSPPSTSSR